MTSSLAERIISSPSITVPFFPIFGSREKAPGGLELSWHPAKMESLRDLSSSADDQYNELLVLLFIGFILAVIEGSEIGPQNIPTENVKTQSHSELISIIDEWSREPLFSAEEWSDLKQNIEDTRLSNRKRFPDQ